MNKDEVVSKVRSLNLLKGEYVVFGSGPLAALGIRVVGDIDMLVSSELLEELRSQGWKQVAKSKDDLPLTHDVFEAHDSWSFSTYSPSLKELLDRSFEVDGVTFASLEDVKKWKMASGRDMDLKDLQLIETYGMRNSESGVSTST